MSRGGHSRESGRLKDSNQRRVLDEATRLRRAKQAIEALDNDNFHDDPHGDLVANKNAPKFHDTLTTRERKKRGAKSADYYKFKYRRTLPQMIEYEAACRPDERCFIDVSAPPSKLPRRHLCAVCGFPAPYSCITCGTRYCSINCQKTHAETRCLKWTA